MLQSTRSVNINDIVYLNHVPDVPSQLPLSQRAKVYAVTQGRVSIQVETENGLPYGYVLHVNASKFTWNQNLGGWNLEV